MTVKFSVVGIYYTNTVDLSNLPGNTVADIIQYLYDTDERFYYSATVYDGKKIISMLGGLYASETVSKSSTTYREGKYFLTQTFDTGNFNPYSVWQYYLTDENGVAVYVQNQESYTTATVQDGWSIVWRLVSILNGPVDVSKRLKSFAPAVG